MAQMDSNHSNERIKPELIKFPRQKLIDTAVNFLQHKHVKNSLLSQKRGFLSKKGLTDEEIDIAIHKANSLPDYDNSHQLTPIDNENSVPIMLHRQSLWAKLYGISSTVIAFSITVYGLHYFYKHYLEPWLSGGQKKSHLDILEEQISEVNRSIAELRLSVSVMQEAVNVQKTDFNKCFNTLKADQELMLNPVKFSEVQAEIASIKSLLLNRHQFPDTPKIPPSIPSWQLIENSEKEKKEDDDDFDAKYFGPNLNVLEEETSKTNLNSDTSETDVSSKYLKTAKVYSDDSLINSAPGAKRGSGD